MIDNKRLNDLRKKLVNNDGTVTVDFEDLEWLLDTVELAVLVHQENFNLLAKIYRLTEELNQYPKLSKKIR